jgi:hypothetical protein
VENVLFAAESALEFAEIPGEDYADAMALSALA